MKQHRFTDPAEAIYYFYVRDGSTIVAEASYVSCRRDRRDEHAPAQRVYVIADPRTKPVHLWPEQLERVELVVMS